MAITVKGSKTRKFILATFGISIAFSIANFLLALLPCVPISYMWDQLNPNTTMKGKCMDLAVVSYTTSACSIVMDLMIWVAPMPLLFKLKIRRSQKIALIGVFSLGGGYVVTLLLKKLAGYALTFGVHSERL